MAILLISNGAGRLPVVEEVDSIETALERYEFDPSFIIVRGSILKAKRVVSIEIDEPKKLSGEAEEYDDIADSAAADTSEPSEHSIDVDEQPEGDSGNASSEGPGDRPES